MYKLKASMMCASCDPRNGKKFEKEFMIKDGDTKAFQEGCATFFGQYNDMVKVAKDVATYATNSKFSFHDKAQKTLDEIKKFQSVSWDKCLKKSADGDKKRILQAPVAKNVDVTHESWTWWRTNAGVDLSTIATASKDCLASEGMQSLLNNFVIHDNMDSFTYYNGLYAAYDSVFALLGNKIANMKYSAFKGKVIKGSFKKAGVKAKLSLKKPKVIGKNTTTPKKEDKKKDAKKDDKKKDDKKDDKKKDSKKDDKKKDAKKDDKKKDAKKDDKKKRRLQAPVKSNSGTVKTSADGVSMENYDNSGLDTSGANFSGEGQADLSGKLLKTFATLMIAFIAIFIN